MSEVSGDSRSRLENQINDDYQSYQARKEGDKGTRDLQSTLSDISVLMSRAHSELTTTSQADSLYKKWEGIIKSGMPDSNVHFFDQHASMKISRESDQNLKVVHQLQKELSNLKALKLSDHSMKWNRYKQRA